MKILFILIMTLLVSTTAYSYTETNYSEWKGEAVMVVGSLTAVKDHDSVAAHSFQIDFDTMAECNMELENMEDINFPIASYIPGTGTSVWARCLRVRTPLLLE